MKNLKNYILGKPLKSSDIHHEKFSVFRGLPVLSSDAISSVAYACEEILWVFVPVLGIASFTYLSWVTLSIIGLLAILIFSYRQTIDSYPKGGGSYIVSRENLGEIPSLVAGASLTIDYILTVAVSTTAGVAAITSAFEFLLPYKVEITLFIILIIAIGNLRGISESAKLFSFPTYIFILSSVIMIVFGLIKYFVYGVEPISNPNIPRQVHDLTILLFLKGFSAGCTALTGVEAISDGVANFKEPATKNAKRVLYLLFIIVIVMFSGISYLATIYTAVPTLDRTVISQIASQVFGDNSIMFYIMQFATTLILTMAANTAYSDFPLLLSFIARDGYAPRQFAKRGDRLSYSNGIIFLSVAAGILVGVFKGENHYLLPLYAVGVFISFTLSQSGMVMRWYKTKGKGWKHKAFINGVGAIITFITAIIIAINKFMHGAWLVLVLVPLAIIVMKRVNRHYKRVAAQLSLENNYFPKFSESQAKRFIIPVASLNESVVKTINYAKCLSNDITAFHISVDDAETEKLKMKWKKYSIDIPLVVKKHEYREVVNPLVKYVTSDEFTGGNKDDMITVVIPQFITKKWWGNILHNQTALFLKRILLQHRNIAVISVPFIIEKYED
ncbi:amino acid/polyamine/organocation transporter, APC superfamily [Clostridium cavendishii DSM 21758]|uniref:Amino acid/polyamine/organocation transporter, APC superfamily n=1 Tax=Clostridium cavendishii DSM 21758 TaxID=1121302 RepID=A0A1M6QUT9_9CLOT|nr:APC family permease [Clostridium cavendishii]SHK23797.1 amino acid/polyamine/organocation transporter, APC superfamily [Clostridium cavendishii DSM 21758]